MTFRRFRALVSASPIAVLALGVAACGGGASHANSASDRTSGLTVKIAGDQVTLERTATSTAGTGGVSGKVGCTDDYRKLIKAAAEPAPTQSWYAATLITWPAASKQSTATLSHALSGDPDLCVAETSDSSTQVVVYFRANVRSDVAKLQQASQASPALQAAAQVAVTAVKAGSFPAVASLVQAMTNRGFYVKQASNVSDVTETGTMYVITSQTTKKTLVMALKDTQGAVQTVTQGVKGAAKVSTAKP